MSTPKQGSDVARATEDNAAAKATLHAAQECFQRHMLGSADASALLSGSAERRKLGLGIYANAYRRRLIEALADAFAKTSAWLGTEFFERVALAYIEQHPPRTRNLRWYGADFADRLPADLPRRATVAELMRLEWALRDAFDGPDSEVLDSDCLADIAPQDWGTLRWQAVPMARLLVFHFNTIAVWQALDDEQAVPLSERGSGAVHWLVWRKELQPHFRSLSPVEAELLHAQFAGSCFSEACLQAQARFEDLGAEQIGTCLRQWLDDGVIAACWTASKASVYAASRSSHP